MNLPTLATLPSRRESGAPTLIRHCIPRPHARAEDFFRPAFVERSALNQPMRNCPSATPRRSQRATGDHGCGGKFAGALRVGLLTSNLDRLLIQLAPRWHARSTSHFHLRCRRPFDHASHTIHRLQDWRGFANRACHPPAGNIRRLLIQTARWERRRQYFGTLSLQR